MREVNFAANEPMRPMLIDMEGSAEQMNAAIVIAKLEAEKVECIKSMKWQRLDEVWLEQAAIGTPCFTFLHAFSEDDPPRPLLLHPQVLSDSRGVVEFGLMFLEHWHERA